MARWQAGEARRRQRRAEVNNAYRERTARLRLAEAEAMSRDIGLMSSLLFPEDGQ